VKLQLKTEKPGLKTFFIKQNVIRTLPDGKLFGANFLPKTLAKTKNHCIFAAVIMTPKAILFDIMRK